MLSKILLRSQSLWQLIIAFLGSFLGVLILLVALQFYFDLWKTMVVKSEVLNEDYLVIQKHVGDFSTLNIMSADFNRQEIEEEKLPEGPAAEIYRPLKRLRGMKDAGRWQHALSATPSEGLVTRASPPAPSPNR